MFSFSFYSCISYLLLLVIHLTIMKSTFFAISVVPCYNSPDHQLMPVTTRLQAKRLQDTSCDHSFYSTSESQVYSTTSFSTSICNSTTAASSTVSTCNSTTTASSFFSPDIPSLYVNDLQPVVPSSSAIQSSLEISNLKISNNTSFDPGIP
jgi:hypothetical protein